MFEFENERTGMAEKNEEMVNRKQYAPLRDLLLPMAAADIALVFEELPEEAMPLVFRLLSTELAAEVFVELVQHGAERSAGRAVSGRYSRYRRGNAG